MVTLTEQEYKYLDEAVKDPPRRMLIGRRVANIFGPLGEGVLTVEWNKISEVGEAQLFRSQKITLCEDVIDRTVGSLDMPALARGFRIPRRTLEAARRMGTPIDAATARSASYMVSLLEDTLVLKGTEGINGLYDGAGNTKAGDDWATPTNIPVNISEAILEMKADNMFPPYNLVLSAESYEYLFQLVGTTSDYYYDLVKRRIGGDIFETPVLTDGTGMLLEQPGAGFFDLPLGVDIHAEVEELPLNEFKDLYGVVWGAITPRIRESNAICTLTGLT